MRPGVIGARRRSVPAIRHPASAPGRSPLGASTGLMVPLGHLISRMARNVLHTSRTYPGRRCAFGAPRSNAGVRLRTGQGSNGGIQGCRRFFCTTGKTKPRSLTVAGFCALKIWRPAGLLEQGESRMTVLPDARNRNLGLAGWGIMPKNEPDNHRGRVNGK